MNGAQIPDAPAVLESTQLRISYLTQRPYANLCWAACCTMILNANGIPQTVLGVAEEVTGLPGDANPANCQCDTAIDPECALNKVHLPYLNPTPTQGPLDAASLSYQVCTVHKPVEVFWRYISNPNSGHVGLIVGFDPASQTFLLADPWYGFGWVNHDELISHFGIAQWFKSYYAIGGALGIS